MDKKDFPALTGMRFIASSLVFLFHYAHLILPQNKQSFAYFFMRQLNIGVNLFFVLSGFLIAYRYSDLRFSGRTFSTYVVRRVARIFPLYFVLVGGQFMLLYLSINYRLDAKTVFLNITLLKGLHADYFFSGLAQSWSLTVEEMFYLFAPFAFFLLKRNRIFLGLFVPLIGLGYLLWKLFASPSGIIYFDSVYFMWVGTFFGRGFEFFVGIYLAQITLAAKKGPPSKHRYTLWGGLMFIVFLSLLAFITYKTNDNQNSLAPAKIALFNFLIPASVGLLYYGLMNERNLLTQILSSKPAVLLGKSSYAFYLLHVGMMAEVIFYHGISNFLLFYITLQALSIAAYKWFEKPVYFFILRKFMPSR